MGIWMDEEVTPGNINGFSYKFTIEANGKKSDVLVYFKLTIETREGRNMPDGTSCMLIVTKGKKTLAVVPIEVVRKDKVIEVKSVGVAGDCLEDSTIQFAISPGLVPSGAGFTFHLGKFVKP